MCLAVLVSNVAFKEAELIYSSLVCRPAFVGQWIEFGQKISKHQQETVLLVHDKTLKICHAFNLISQRGAVFYYYFSKDCSMLINRLDVYKIRFIIYHGLYLFWVFCHLRSLEFFFFFNANVLYDA